MSHLIEGADFAEGHAIEARSKMYASLPPKAGYEPPQPKGTLQTVPRKDLAYFARGPLKLCEWTWQEARGLDHSVT